MGIILNVNCFIHDDAYDAFMARSCHNLGVSSNTPTPADLFTQSVVKRDAAIGWHQICSSVQSQVPLGACRPGGEAAHRGGWYEIIGVWVSAGFRGTTDTH